MTPLIGDNRDIKQWPKVTIKQVSVEKESTGCTNKQIHDVVIRCIVDGKLTNLNVMLTKLGLAECVNMAIFDGEKSESPKPVEKLNEVKMLPSRVQPSEMDKEVKKLTELCPNKLITDKPKNMVMCKVTNAVSPNEIWLIDIVDSSQCYEAFQQLLAKKYTQFIESGESDLMQTSKWQINDYCVLMRQCIGGQGKFHRARVVEKSPKTGKFKLICLDNGNYEECVDEKNMFVLIDELM